jgi:hypothetical protein
MKKKLLGIVVATFCSVALVTPMTSSAAPANQDRVNPWECYEYDPKYPNVCPI